ncbi:MAG: vanadium-dependent haloperoxidase [Chitinophagaceae bacterium]
MKKLLFLIICFGAFASCKNKKDYKTIFSDPFLYEKTIHDIGDVMIYDIFTPPVASRIFTYSNIAAYEVLSRGNDNYPSLTGKVMDLNNIPNPENKEKIYFPFASIIALTRVSKELTFSDDTMQHLIDSIKTLAKNSNMPDDIYESSVKYGEQVADSVMAWSKKDNYAQTRGARWTISNQEGHWKPTPPGYFDAVEPKWMTMRCIAMDSANMFPAPGLPPFSTKPGSDFYKMALGVMDTVNNLTTTQKWIANFWDCNSFKLHVAGHMMFATKAMTPCGHWMEITGTVCKLKHADFYKTAYTYTAVSIGMFDAFIASWYCKYHWDVIRPETYINMYINPDWQPYLQTPPFPEYNSAHSTISAASATILTKIYGDNFSFKDSSERTWGWPDRTFKSFDAAAMEVSMSRLYGGIHFRKSVLDAYEQGKKIGACVINKLMAKNNNTVDAQKISTN